MDDNFDDSDFVPDSPKFSNSKSFDSSDFIPESVSSPVNSPYGYGNNISSNLSNSPLVNAINGAGDAWRNSYAAGINSLTGSKIPYSDTSDDSISSGIGKIAGNIGAFAAGGEVLDALRLGAVGIPMIGKAFGLLSDTGALNGVSSWLPGVARRAIGVGGYSALTDQNNRALGGAEGIGTSLASELLPQGAQGIAQVSKYFMPGAYVKNILQSLGDGQTLEDAVKSVTGSVKDAYDNQVGVSNVPYNLVLNSAGDRDIFKPRRDPYIFGTQAKEGEYQNLSPSIFNNYDSDLSDIHNKFFKDTIFGNAHKLQSQLATNIRSLKGGNIAPDIATQNAISYLEKARGSIQNDMGNFLQNESPHLAEIYSNGSKNFYENVAPYRANPNIYEMATGDLTNIKPTSLGNIFSAPDENIQKVVSDLPKDAINNILYTKMGQRVPKMNPDAFMRNYDSLDQLGLNSYITPELQEQISSLKQRMSAKNALQFGASAALGSALSGGHGGLPATLGMGALGAAIGRPVMNYIQNRLPVDKIAESIGNVLRGTYPHMKNAILANTLNGANQ